MARLASTLALLITATACGGGDGCIEDVPFSGEWSVDHAEAQRLATELGTTDLQDECEAACTLLVEEDETPDGATYSVTEITSCTLVMPSFDDAGDPVAGSVRCQGSNTRCEP